MDYKHDVFLSYKHGFLKDWVHEHFLPLFRWHLEGALGRRPEVFSDRPGIPTGHTWRLRLKKALAHSRCLVAIWSPSYFYSEWCMRECCVMLHRERQLGYRTMENPSGLVLPVIASNGEHFPDFAKEIQAFDCRKFARVGKGFTDTVRFFEFQDTMEDWVKEVAAAINQAPPWREGWLDDPVIDIPKIPIPEFGLPVLE